ncbi:LytR family transcriptional regulator, partial [Streptomyces anthocyanicus]
MPAESTPEPEIPGEPGTSAPRRGTKGRRRKARSTRSKALLITAWSAAGIVVLGGTGAGYLYFKLNGNIKSVDINQALGSDRPTKVDNGSENI